MSERWSAAGVFQEVPLAAVLTNRRGSGTESEAASWPQVRSLRGNGLLAPWGPELLLLSQDAQGRVSEVESLGASGPGVTEDPGFGARGAEETAVPLGDGEKTENQCAHVREVSFSVRSRIPKCRRSDLCPELLAVPSVTGAPVWGLSSSEDISV